MTSSATVSAPSAAGAGIWQIDPAHTDVQFAVKHLMISTVKGRFAGVNGVIHIDDRNPSAASAEVTIGVRSIDTRQQQRDDHLRSPDFFDAERFPTITFRGRRIQGDPRGDFQLLGDLTIRDITREVVLQVSSEGRVKDPWGSYRAGFSATTRISRKEFGLNWNDVLESGGVVVGDQVNVSIEIELVRQESAAAA